MVDPVSAAAAAAARTAVSSVSRKLLTRTAPRLGGRDERRAVYARFQHALAEGVSFAQYLRIERQFGPQFMAQRTRRELAMKVHERQTELLQAYLEMRLVGNAEPVAAADEVMDKTSAVLDKISSSDEEFQAAIAEAMAMQRDFTDVCRADLWYLPQWWQLYRGAWWKSRVKWLRRR
ncbi:hypothetical protein AB0N09_17360 [Streptomyces erythrochromogenes]|uniref:hypothetical protein n=1 Tax=Streptomyces TaxID=1883 RepID=UPI003416999B